MSKKARMTPQTLAVLFALLKHPSEGLYGLEIARRAGYQPGTIHPILARFEALGWLISWREDVDPSDAGRPARRYYRLSPDGAIRARIAIEASAATGSSPRTTAIPGLANGAPQWQT
jgi:DNA-binding MarR family transcriptional regulator